MSLKSSLYGVGSRVYVREDSTNPYEGAEKGKFDKRVHCVFKEEAEVTAAPQHCSTAELNYC